MIYSPKPLTQEQFCTKIIFRHNFDKPVKVSDFEHRFNGFIQAIAYKFWSVADCIIHTPDYRADTGWVDIIKTAQMKRDISRVIAENCSEARLERGDFTDIEWALYIDYYRRSVRFDWCFHNCLPSVFCFSGGKKRKLSVYKINNLICEFYTKKT